MGNTSGITLRTNRFYLDQPLAGMTQLTVSGSTAHYLTRVLRLRVGADLVVFDGRGGQYAAIVSEVSRDSVRINLGTFSDPQRESSLRLTLAQGVARGERMDQVLQKSTELGIHTVAPLMTEHTVVRLDRDRSAKRHDHWQKIIISACEQCGRNTLPVLQPVQTLDTWLTSRTEDGLRILLQPDVTMSLQDVDGQADDAAITILIGPEGGLSPQEQQLAIANGFVPLSLGPRILRTETASLAVLSILQSRWGDVR